MSDGQKWDDTAYESDRLPDGVIADLMVLTGAEVKRALEATRPGRRFEDIGQEVDLDPDTVRLIDFIGYGAIEWAAQRALTRFRDRF